MNVLGKSPIKKSLYVTGKFAAYASWITTPLQLLGFNIRITEMPTSLGYILLIIQAIGFLIAVTGVLSLGKSLRFGIPKERTALVSSGIYRFSRNPIYLGFNLMALSSILYAFNPIFIFLGLYGVYVHHLIVLSEESFLKRRFGKKYLQYTKSVRRYI